MRDIGKELERLQRSIASLGPIQMPVKMRSVSFYVDRTFGINKVTGDQYVMTRHRGAKVCATFQQVPPSMAIVGDKP